MTILTPIAVSSAPLLRAIQAGGDLSGKALAEAAGRKPNNISRDLGALEKAGLIAPREPGSPPALTDDGVAVLAELDGGSTAGPATSPGFAEFALGLIDQDPTLNPRTIFDDEELEALASSIRDKGVAQPILIRQGVSAGRYRIVAGERRYRASIKAGKTTIPAMFRELSDDQALEIATIENIQRVDLSPLEEARAFKAIIDARMKADHELELKDAKATIADAVRKTVRYVEQRMDLLELPAITQVRLELDKDDHGHLTLKEARNEVQKQRAREREAKAKLLSPEELLIMAEIYDAAERFCERPPGWYQGHTPVPVGFRALEDDEPLAKLAAKSALQLTKGFRGDPRYFVGEGWAGWTPKEIDRQLPGFLSKERARVLDAFRIRVIGKAEADRIHATWLPIPDGKRGEYASWFLNEPFCSEPAPALVEAAEAYLAREQEERALEFDRNFREQQAKERAEEAKAASVSMLAAVRAFEDEAPGMGHAEFTAAFAALQTRFSLAGPYSLTLDEGRRDVTIRDGAGAAVSASEAGLEARRRMICIALNYAAGLAPTSGDDLDTIWARPDSKIMGVPVDADDDEEEEEEGVEGCEDCGQEVPSVDSEGRCPDCAQRAFDEDQEEDEDNNQIDIEDAIEAQADEDATPDYLRNLAGPGADAEAGQ